MSLKQRFCIRFGWWSLVKLKGRIPGVKEIIFFLGSQVLGFVLFVCIWQERTLCMGPS